MFHSVRRRLKGNNYLNCLHRHGLPERRVTLCSACVFELVSRDSLLVLQDCVITLDQDLGLEWESFVWCRSRGNYESATKCRVFVDRRHSSEGWRKRPNSERKKNLSIHVCEKHWPKTTRWNHRSPHPRGHTKTINLPCTFLEILKFPKQNALSSETSSSRQTFSKHSWFFCLNVHQHKSFRQSWQQTDLFIYERLDRSQWDHCFSNSRLYEKKHTK